MADLRLAERFDHHAPVYVCANALLREGVSLRDAIHLAHEAGADGFELRRELLPPVLSQDEIQRTRAALADLPLPAFYSSPQPMFLHGRFEREPVARALAEARAFGCRAVKFAPGDTLRPDDTEFDALCAMIAASSAAVQDAAHDAGGEDAAPMSLVLLENDQTPVSADVAAWARLFERAAAKSRARAGRCALGMTFDIGNWACLGLDPALAARALGRFVAYVHVKAVRREGDAWVSEPFRPVLAQHPALAELPHLAPRAIEFPVSVPAPAHANAHAALRAKLADYIAVLRQGTFDT